MMTVAYEAFPYLDMPPEKLKLWIHSSKDIIYFNEESKRKVLEQMKRPSKKQKKQEVPLWQRTTLTLEEAAAYSGIGIHKIRQLTDTKNCDFVLWNGNRRLIKRRKFDEYIEKSYSI